MIHSHYSYTKDLLYNTNTQISLSTIWDLYCLYPSSVGLMMTHHVDELRYGQPKLDNDHIGDVWHGSGPLVVTGKQRFEEIILSVRMGLLVTKSCRKRHFKFKKSAFIKCETFIEDRYNMRVLESKKWSHLFNTV